MNIYSRTSLSVGLGLGGVSMAFVRVSGSKLTNDKFVGVIIVGNRLQIKS